MLGVGLDNNIHDLLLTNKVGSKKHDVRINELTGMSEIYFSIYCISNESYLIIDHNELLLDLSLQCLDQCELILFFDVNILPQPPLHGKCP